MRYASTHFVIMISGFFFWKKIEKELRIEDLIYDKEVLFSLNKKKFRDNGFCWCFCITNVSQRNCVKNFHQTFYFLDCFTEIPAAGTPHGSHRI